MKKMITLTTMALFAAIVTTAQPSENHKLVQDFMLVNNKWQPTGQPYQRPDTLTCIHGYQWKGNAITAVQDYKKINDRWQKYGSPYPMPDTITIIHAIIKPKS